LLFSQFYRGQIIATFSKRHDATTDDSGTMAVQVIGGRN
jgi:hypothetical protein